MSVTFRGSLNDLAKLNAFHKHYNLPDVCGIWASYHQMVRELAGQVSLNPTPANLVAFEKAVNATNLADEIKADLIAYSKICGPGYTCTDPEESKRLLIQMGLKMD
jgi:hypothetical protein